MRLRLGLLQNQAALERQAARERREREREQREKEKEKEKAGIPTVLTEEESLAAEREKEKKAAEEGREKEEKKEEKEKPVLPRIRPLSEAKAIDMGANFISETFLFAVAAGIIIFESLRARRKETSRREDVADRLAELEEKEANARHALVLLEGEILRLKAQLEKKSVKEIKEGGKRILPREIWEEEEEEEVEEEGIWTRVKGLVGWMRGQQGQESPDAGEEKSRDVRTGPHYVVTARPGSETSKEKEK